jgi:hypothetical protein
MPMPDPLPSIPTAPTTVPIEIICFNCGKRPDELFEYSPESTGSNLSAVDYVIAEEGTLNRANGHFCCTGCYIRLGQPTAPAPGWTAP